MKRVSSILLTLAMLLSLSVPAWAAESDSSVSTDVNSEAAKAWAGFKTSASTMGINSDSIPSGYGDLTKQQFFIAKFMSSEIGRNNGLDGTTLKFEAKTGDSEVSLTGYVGMYFLMAIPNGGMNVWIGLPYATENHQTAYDKYSVTTGESMVVPGMLAGVNEVYVGFAATEAVDANTTVTISISGNNQVVTRSHTFSASSSAPEIDNTLTGISIKLDEAYGSYYTAFNDYLLFKDGFTDPNPNVTAEEGHDGRSMVLHAVRSPIGATDVVTWSSSPEGIVEFQTSNDGSDCTVIAKAVGDAIVTASAGSFSASVPVRVVSTTYSVNSTSYNTLSDAIVAAGDNETISVKGSASIAGVYVADGATVTAVSDNAVQSTNSTATVTPKTLTIANGANQKTAKAYVISSNEGGDAKSTVVTDVKVASNSGITNEAPVVENLVNVAQVLANAVAANATGDNAIDVSSISSMELRLDKTDNTASVTLTGTDSEAKTELESKLSNNSVTVYDVKPIATVTTATTTGGTTTTQTYDYDASKEVTGSFTFKLNVGSPADAGKTANLTHYHENNDGTWTATPITGIVDSNGDVTVTLNQFSYISVDGLEYEVFGEVYDFDAVFGNKNEFNITFLYDESIRDNLDGYAVKLYLDDNGTERELTETSGSDYLNSDITTYKTDGVKTGSSGAKYQVFTVKMFAKYFASDIIVKLVKNDEAVNITSYNNSAFGISAEVGTQFGYSMVDFVDLKIAGFNAVSDSANAAKYTTLKSAITAYGSALSALD